MVYATLVFLYARCALSMNSMYKLIFVQAARASAPTAAISLMYHIIKASDKVK